MITGKVVERELLGRTEVPPQFRERIKNIYIPYKRSLELAKRLQPANSDPSDPDSFFANDLHATIAEVLDIEDYSDLKFFTAVDSPLDVKHGVDAFFIFSKDGEEIVITMDVTTNPKKDEHKADIVFLVPYGGYDTSDKNDKMLYSEKVREVSDMVVKIIRQKQLGIN